MEYKLLTLRREILGMFAPPDPEWVEYNMAEGTNWGQTVKYNQGMTNVWSEVNTTIMRLRHLEILALFNKGRWMTEAKTLEYQGALSLLQDEIEKF